MNAGRALLRGDAIDLIERAAGGLARWQLSRVMAHIETHLAGPIRMAELAGIIRLSYSHFFRGFKASIGTTPLMFIARRRIARACELMKTTDDPLSQIAVDCGLCDQPHFCRMFRRIMGNTPSAWRKINAPINPRVIPRS
jgi:AraC-like DNA-binding protein